MSEENPTKKEIKEYIKNNSLEAAQKKFGKKAVLFALLPTRTGNTKLQKGPYKYDPNKPRTKLEKGPYKYDPNKQRVKLKPANKMIDLRESGLFK